MDKVFLVIEYQQVDYEGTGSQTLYACSTPEKAAEKAQTYVFDNYGKLVDSDEQGRWVIDKTACTFTYVCIEEMQIDAE